MNFRTSAIVLIASALGASPAMAAIAIARIPSKPPSRYQQCMNVAAQNYSDRVGGLQRNSAIKDADLATQLKKERSQLDSDRRQCSVANESNNPQFKECVAIAIAIALDSQNMKTMPSDMAQSRLMQALQSCDDRFLLKTVFEGSGGPVDRIGRRCPEDPRKDPGCTITSLPDVAYVNVPTIERLTTKIVRLLPGQPEPPPTIDKKTAASEPDPGFDPGSVGGPGSSGGTGTR